jgi:hypothetical protein
VDRLQALAEGPGADYPRGEPVGRQLLAAGDGVRDPEEELRVGDEDVAQGGTALRERLDGAEECLVRLVDPGPELRVAAVVVAEFVAQDTSKLRHLEDPEQRESDGHHPPAAEPHEAAALAHPGIHVHLEVGLFGHGLAGRRGDAAQLLEEPRMLLRLQGRAGGDELVAARQDRPEDHAGAGQADRGQLDVDAMAVMNFGVDDKEEAPDHREGERVEPDHERHGQEGAAGEGRLGRVRHLLKQG